MRRIAVTGIGVICPLGNSATEVIANATAGRSAVRRLEAPWSARLSSALAARADFAGEAHFDPPKLRMLDRISQFALVAAREALADAQLELSGIDRQRVGVFVGTGVGGSLTTDAGYQTLYAEQSDRIKPFTVLMAMAHAPAAWIGIEYGVTGPTLTYSTACSSSSVAIGEAWMRLRSGELDVAIAGGTEAPLSLGTMRAWDVLHTLAGEDPADASRSCKPFAQDRSGMVLGEGAGILVLEEWAHALRRGAIIHGELIGYAVVTDAGHISRPTAAGQAAAMRAALRSAACAAAAIDSIQAHATGTAANDSAETAAIKQVFGDDAYRIPISATKAIHGHLLGASGALSAVLSLLAMQRRVLLPTMHLLQPAADCDLDYVPNSARHDARVDTVLCNCFAFGGTNTALVLRSAH
ncbi:MAG: beta-ketoacyl-[acyl-carrier-protein] synthase family protein [Steroidobacteraceae bacterium]